jgi:hypothetical protein
MDARGSTTDGDVMLAQCPARRARVLAWGLQGVAVVAAVAAAALGGAPVELGVMLVLVLGAALCVNRQALFTAEIAVTAEASVVLCAVVLFRDDAPVLAPMVIGLAAGWLDSFHWTSRAWTPMAFNSGTRAVEAMLAALAFHAVVHAFGQALGGLAVAAIAASLAFASADLALITLLVVVRGRRAMAEAAREVWRIDAVSIPLALAGAAAGLLGASTTLLIGAIAVLPAAFVPDALLAARSRGSWRRLGIRAAGAALAVAAAAAVGLVVGFPSAPVTGALVALGLLAGVELVADRRLPTTPVLGAAVLLAVAAVHPRDAVIAAVTVGVVAASVTWSLAGVRRTRFVFATGATLVIAGATGLVVARGASTTMAFAAFALGVLVAEPRRVTAAAIVWSFPFVALGATAGLLHPWASVLATLLSGTAVLVVAAVTAAWSGPPPWRSRLATRWARARLRVSHRAVWTALGAVSLAAASLAASAAPSSAPVAVVGLAMSVELAAAVALTRVRLWRFVRARRVIETVLLDVAAGAASGAAALARDDPPSALALAVGAAVVVFALGATTIAVAERAESVRRRRHDRTTIEPSP